MMHQWFWGILVYGLVIAVASDAFADGFVRKREPRNYMPTYGSYQKESDVNEEMRSAIFPWSGDVPPNVYYSMTETIPGTQTVVDRYEPEDLTCGGEFYLPPHEMDLDKDDPFFDLKKETIEQKRYIRAVIATNEWLRALERVAPWPELKTGLDRYKMRAYEIDFWGDFWGALVYESPVKAGKLPLIVYIPGEGEIGENLARQFNQHKLFDVVTSAEFQSRHPCHLLALSPIDPDNNGNHVFDDVFGRRTYRMMHKVAKEALNGRVDWSRVYLTGFSYGASRAFDIVENYPDKYAAGLFVAGMIPRVDVLIRLRGDDLPPQNFWYVANASDSFGEDEYWLNRAKMLKSYVNSHGGDCRVSYFPDARGHDAWSRAWDCMEIWDWMFSKRSGVKSGNSVLMQLPDPKCSASVDAIDLEHGAERPTDMLNGTYYSPAIPFSSDDWWQAECDQPVKGKVVVMTGDQFGKRRLVNGFVECSVDGGRWKKAGVFSKKTGSCEFKSQPNVRFFRVRSNNASADFVIRCIAYSPL